MLLKFLICGEDRRFYNHFGYDPIAIIRSILRRLIDGRREGASTIEQQFTRTCIRKYEITISRKINEILISSLLKTIANKEMIAHSYLDIAYYGSNIIGPDQAIGKLKNIYNGEFEEDFFLAALIASLKNPIPINLTKKWKIKHLKRTLHIKNKFNNISNWN